MVNKCEVLKLLAIHKQERLYSNNFSNLLMYCIFNFSFFALQMYLGKLHKGNIDGLLER